VPPLFQLSQHLTAFIDNEEGWNSFENIYDPIPELVEGVHPQIPTVKMWWRHKNGSGGAGRKDYETNFAAAATNITKYGAGAGPHELGHTYDLGHYHNQADAMGGGGMYWFGRDTRERTFQRLNLFPSIIDENRIYQDPVHPYASDYYLQTGLQTSVSVNILDNSSDANGDVISVKDFENISSRGGLITKSGTTLTYTPPEGFKGRDSFNYVIESGSGTGLFNASAKVLIDVHAENSLILHYGFEEEAFGMVNDLSFNGSSNIGRLVNTSFNHSDVSVNGKLGKALQLNGGGGVLLNDIADPLLGSQTISLWFKQDVSSDGVIFDTGAKGGLAKSGITIEIESGELDINVQHEDTDDTGANIKVPINQTSDGWSYLVLVIDRATSSIKGYMNGQLEATASIPDDGFIKGRVESSRISSSIGFMMSGTTKDFDAIYNNLEDKFTGIIDEFKIYNRALSSSEILSDFNAYEAEDFTVQGNLNNSGLFPIPILNGSFDTDKILITNLFHDWMKFGSISLVDKDENPVNTLGKKSVELKKVNWANKSSIYQQIGYFKNDLNFKVNFKTALGKRGGYAGCRINIYVGGSNVYNDLELSSSTLGVTPPTKLFSYEVPSGTFPSSNDWIEITTDDFDFQTLSTSYTENAPLYIEFETTTSQAGNKTLLDDIEVSVNTSNDAPTIIDFTDITKTFGDDDFILTGTSSSTGAISYTVSDTTGCYSEWRHSNHCRGRNYFYHPYSGFGC
jgi:hypothetical protein